MKVPECLDPVAKNFNTFIAYTVLTNINQIMFDASLIIVAKFFKTNHFPYLMSSKL